MLEDLWLMTRIFLVVLAWGGLLLFAGFGLEMLGRVFGRGGDSPAEAEREAAPSATAS